MVEKEKAVRPRILLLFCIKKSPDRETSIVITIVCQAFPTYAAPTVCFCDSATREYRGDASSRPEHGTGFVFLYDDVGKELDCLFESFS